MNRVLVTIAATALVGIPLAAQAQDRDGYQGDGRDASVRSATAHGYASSARTYDRNDRRAGATDNRAYYRGQVAGGRGYYSYGGVSGRFRGGVAVGYGARGYYPYAGYYPDAGGYRAGGYGADYAYSYPDQYGTYQPFAYDYSAGDDSYNGAGPAYGDGADDAGGPAYAGEADTGGPAYGGEANEPPGPAYGADGYYAAGPTDGGGYGQQAAPDAGWSAGGPPADCGQWVWREGPGAYQWVAAPCSYPQ